MKVTGLQSAVEARRNKNVFSLYEITTVPGLADRIEYLLYAQTRIDELRYHRRQTGGLFPGMRSQMLQGSCCFCAMIIPSRFSGNTLPILALPI